MTTPLPFAGYEIADLASLRTASGVMGRGLLIDLLRKGWSSIALGIIMAGGAYPVIVGMTVMIISVILDTPHVAPLIGYLFLIWIYSAIAALVGLVWTNVVVVVTLPAMLLVVWSLRMRGCIVWLGAFWGGLVGFVAAWPLVFLLGLPSTAVALAMGPGLATIIGQIGGAWGGRRALERIGWYERALARASVEERLLGTTRLSVAGEPDENESAAEGGATARSERLQFGIRHLMWAAVWLSVLLSLIRVIGVPLEFAVPVLAGWVVYQAITLVVGGMLIGWYARLRTGAYQRVG